MNLTFDFLAVRRWAEFSGDFNPIHFDLAHAHKVGMNKLIVHGMLALMPIKQMLARDGRTSTRAPAGWIKFKAAFRHPLAHDNNHLLATHAVGDKTSFQLSSGDANRIEHFRGSFGPVAAMPSDVPLTPQSPSMPDHRFALDRAQLALFAQTYADISEYWVALDAVVFAQFMRSGLPIVEQMVVDAYATSQSARSAPNDTDFNFNFKSNKVVVQTSHCVTVDATLDAMLSAKLDSTLDATPNSSPDATLNSDKGDLHWALMPPVLLIHGTQVSGSVSLPVYHDNRLVMLVEIGLLAKVSHAPLLQ